MEFMRFCYGFVWKEKGDILRAMDRIDEADQCFAKAKELEEE